MVSPAKTRGYPYPVCKNITIHHECPCRIGEISPEGLEFLPGTRLAESLDEIPTPRVRFPYLTWTGS